MSKLLVALIAASFATVAGAQAGATKQEKQSTVQSVTKQDAMSTTAQGEAADVAKAKAQKGTAKALPDKASKQAATASTTKAQTEGGATAVGPAEEVPLRQGEAVLVPDATRVTVTGTGRAFLAGPGCGRP